MITNSLSRFGKPEAKNHREEGRNTDSYYGSGIFYELSPALHPSLIWSRTEETALAASAEGLGTGVGKDGPLPFAQRVIFPGRWSGSPPLCAGRPIE